MRCRYCLPNGAPAPLPREEILTFEEIARIVRIASDLGVNRVRFTGGEPLLRRDLHRLVAMTRAIDAINEIALTTNGLLLESQLPGLIGAGLTTVSISIDSIRPDVFRDMTGSNELPRVTRAIETASRAKDISVELNAVAVKGKSESEIVPLVEYARDLGIPIRFIELMPFEDVDWNPERLLTGREVEAIIGESLGQNSYTEVERSRPAAPARRFSLATPVATSDQPISPSKSGFGLIEPVSNPFCASCDRLRLRSDGALFNCLFGRTGYDLRTPLREGTDDAVRALLHQAVAEKGPGGMLEFKTQVESRARIMASIGG